MLGLTAEETAGLFTAGIKAQSNNWYAVLIARLSVFVAEGVPVYPNALIVSMPGAQPLELLY